VGGGTGKLPPREIDLLSLDIDGRGLHSFTLELNLSNSKTHS